MRKQILTVVALLMMVGVASAQQSKSDETLEFRPHWSLRVQGGAAYTVGKAPFGKLISPAAQISVAYDFHHAMGVRLGVSGFQGKGGIVNSEDIYGFRFAQLNADYVLDLANIIGGFKHDRLVSPYVFAGIGGAYGFDNVEASQMKVKYPDQLGAAWETAPFFVGRAGLGADLWLTQNISLGLELNANYYGDKLNSNTSDNGDWQLNSLLGMKLRFGGNTAPSKTYLAAQEAAAAEAAAMAALKKAEAERLAAEKAAADKAAAEKAEAERLAAEKAAAAKAAAEKAAAEHAALAAENSQDIFFKIGSHEILKAGSKKLEALADFMKNHEDYTLLIVGYADKATGTAAVNMKVSARRAEAVKNRLVDLGVSETRMTVTYKGATEQPYEEIVKNRVAICTLK